MIQPSLARGNARPPDLVERVATIGPSPEAVERSADRADETTWWLARHPRPRGQRLREPEMTLPDWVGQCPPPEDRVIFERPGPQPANQIGRCPPSPDQPPTRAEAARLAALLREHPDVLGPALGEALGGVIADVVAQLLAEVLPVALQGTCHKEGGNVQG
jgi:hypothetical protein